MRRNRNTQFSDTIYLEFDDFKNGEEIEKLLGVNFEEIDELECELSCSITKGSRQTHWQPADYPECEDLKIIYTVKGKNFELTDKLTDKVLDRYSEQATEDGLTNEQDEYEAAMEAKGDEMRDREYE